MTIYGKHYPIKHAQKYKDTKEVEDTRTSSEIQADIEAFGERNVVKYDANGVEIK